MTENQTAQLDKEQLLRLKAVELAIQEINVYVKSGNLNCNTARLLSSAEDIAKFLETGTVPGAKSKPLSSP